jgi:hypothetical protein
VSAQAAAGFFFFFKTVSYYVVQGGLEPQNFPASVSRVLGLQMCTTMPGLPLTFISQILHNLSTLDLCHEGKIS